jgi:hypothetical protein
VRLLREACAVVPVGVARAGGGEPVDYRLLPAPLSHAEGGPPEALPADARRALAPRPRGAFLHGSGAEASLESLWERHWRACAGAQARSRANGSLGSFASGEGGAPPGVAAEIPVEIAAEIPVAFGRTLQVRRRCGSACWFTFDELCARRVGRPSLGSADFLALSSAANGLFLSGVPVLEQSMRNEARRFVTLVDALYDARVQLWVASAAPLDEVVRPLLEGGAHAAAEGAEVEVGQPATGAAAALEVGRELGASYQPRAPASAQVPAPQGPSFEEAPVGGRFRVDGELAAFFTGKDEAFMLRRTVSRLKEMCRSEEEA